MKFLFAISAISLLVFSGCVSGRDVSKGRISVHEAAGKDTGKEACMMHRRMKPLQRPQVRFDMERAVRSGDSC